MTPALLTLALLSSPHYRAPAALAPALAIEIVDAERRYALPTGLLAAVVLHESGGRLLISSRRWDGGRDHGPAQIHIGRDTQPRHNPLSLRGNLREGARLLARSREICGRHPRWRACRRSEWALYNAASPKWWGRVERIWRQMMRGGEV